jgi:hypothetical protein
MPIKVNRLLMITASPARNGSPLVLTLSPPPIEASIAAWAPFFACSYIEVALAADSA